MKFLRDKPLIGAFVVLILYIIFLAIPVFLVIPFIFQFYDFNYISSLFLNFALIFGFLLLFLLVIIPYVLRLPLQFKHYSGFLENVGILKLKPRKNILVITLAGILLYFIFALIGSLLLGQKSFDFLVLFQPPTRERNGLFSFVRQLRPGICEELAFRGIILPLLLTKYSEKTAVTINGFLFGIMHFINLLQGAALFSTIFQVIYATVFGITFAIIFKRTKSLIPPIIIHYLINIFSNVFYQATGTFTDIFVSIFLVGIMIPSMIMILLAKRLKINKHD